MDATAFRLRSQHLSARAPAGSAVEVARRLCGVHAQMLPSADLILWARVRGYRPGALETLLWKERSLVKTWLQRGTLHLVPADDLPLYVGALDNRGEYQGAWLRGFRVTAEEMERLIEAVGAVLGARGLTREELVDAVAPALGRKLAARLGSGWGELLKPAARRGVLCFGPDRGRNVTLSARSGGCAAGESRRDARRRRPSCCAASSRRTGRRRPTTSSAGSASTAG